MESKAEIGASVSRDLKRAALIAIAISLAGIVLYLAWRFDRRFGVAAAVATFHDVLTVLGIFYLLDKEITLLVVTALLTLAGYSLTDTVVVFDRIRENLRKKGRQESERSDQPQYKRGAQPHHHHLRHGLPGAHGPAADRRGPPARFRPGAVDRRGRGHLLFDFRGQPDRLHLADIRKETARSRKPGAALI